MTHPHRRLLLAVLACAPGLGACASAHTDTGFTTSSATHRASATGTARPAADAPAAQHAAVSLFAAAYVRYLDATAAASGLPDATPGVRGLAAQAGPIPPARRQGTLVIAELRPAIDAGDSYLLTARDDAHTLYAQITLTLAQDGRWVVTQLTPPDLAQVFAPAGPPPLAPPPGSIAALHAARQFLRGYLPWLYGQAPLRAITAATNELLAGLNAHPPRVPPTIRLLRANVAAIAMQHSGRGWQALANINDTQETYELVLTVEHTANSWLVNNVSSAR